MVVNDGRAAGYDKGVMTIIPYGRQFIDEEDINEVIKVLKSDFLTQGPKIQEFENQLIAYCGAKYAVVFNSGTSALHGAYFALGLNQGDNFITSPITFAATANAGLYLGAKPVFVDIEADTGNIDVFKIKENISSKTKMLVPVHYAGSPVDMEKLYHIAQRCGIFIVEDACHALGAKYNGELIGGCKYSDMTVFSFHPVKHITTGEGGAVLTNNRELYEKLLIFRTHGITKSRFMNESHGDWYYEMQILGFNYRLTDIQAALGISQLKKLNMFVEQRRKIVESYNAAFKDTLFFDIPVEKDYAYNSYHLYPIRLKEGYKRKKKDIFNMLKNKNLGVQVHYIPVYWHPYYSSLGYRKGLCPVAEEFYEQEITIPVYPAMTDDNVQYVIDTLNAVFENAA